MFTLKIMINLLFTSSLSLGYFHEFNVLALKNEEMWLARSSPFPPFELLNVMVTAVFNAFQIIAKMLPHAKWKHYGNTFDQWYLLLTFQGFECSKLLMWPNIFKSRLRRKSCIGNNLCCPQQTLNWYILVAIPKAMMIFKGSSLIWKGMM